MLRFPHKLNTILWVLEHTEASLCQRAKLKQNHNSSNAGGATETGHKGTFAATKSNFPHRIATRQARGAIRRLTRRSL